MPYKVCNHCSEQNGVRTLVCKKCNTPFKIKSQDFNKQSDTASSHVKRRSGHPRRLKKRKKELIKDWRSLIRGDIIRVVGGSGTFYQTSDGMRHYLTNRGKYEVESIDSNGIHVRGVAPRTSGHQFLYMGPLTKSSLCTSLYRDKHKLLAVSLQPRESNGV